MSVEMSLVAPENLVPVNEAHTEYPHLFDNSGQVSWLMRKRHQNGVDSAVVRVGRRLFLDKERFSAWLASRVESA